MKRWVTAAVVVCELGTAAAVGVLVCFGLDAAAVLSAGAPGQPQAALHVALLVAGLGVALGLLVWGLRRRAARRGEYPRTMVYDPEAGGWVAARRRGPRLGS